MLHQCKMCISPNEKSYVIKMKGKEVCQKQQCCLLLLSRSQFKYKFLWTTTWKDGDSFLPFGYSITSSWFFFRLGQGGRMSGLSVVTYDLCAEQCWCCSCVSLGCLSIGPYFHHLYANKNMRVIMFGSGC